VCVAARYGQFHAITAMAKTIDRAGWEYDVANACCFDGLAALHLAVGRRDAAVVRALIALGADVHAASSHAGGCGVYRGTPRDVAARLGWLREFDAAVTKGLL